MKNKKIDEKIITIRGQQGLLDRDLAELFGMETKIFNQSILSCIFRFVETS